VVILAPKREGKGPKTPPNSSSSTKRPVSRKNLDPELVATVPDLEKLSRKPKVICGESSLSKGQLSSKRFQGQSSEIIKPQSDEEVTPESEIKPVIEPATISFPSTILELNLNQWKLLAELIEEEHSNTLFVAEALRDHNKYIKSEPKILSSSFGSLSYEEIKPHYYSFENPLFLGPSFDSSLEKKPLFAEDQDSLSVHLSCHTQGTVSPSTSPILLTPKSQTPKIANMALNRMDAIVAARYAPLILPQLMYAFPPNDYMK
jgi:hypothetical protein